MAGTRGVYGQCVQHFETYIAKHDAINNALRAGGGDGGFAPLLVALEYEEFSTLFFKVHGREPEKVDVVTAFDTALRVAAERALDDPQFWPTITSVADVALLNDTKYQTCIRECYYDMPECSIYSGFCRMKMSATSVICNAMTARREILVTKLIEMAREAFRTPSRIFKMEHVKQCLGGAFYLGSSRPVGDDVIYSCVTFHVLKYNGSPLDMQLCVPEMGNPIVHFTLPGENTCACSLAASDLKLTDVNICDTFERMPLQFVVTYLLLRTYTRWTLPLQKLECIGKIKHDTIMQEAAQLFRHSVFVTSRTNCTWWSGIQPYITHFVFENMTKLMVAVKDSYERACAASLWPEMPPLPLNADTKRSALSYEIFAQFFHSEASKISVMHRGTSRKLLDVTKEAAAGLRDCISGAWGDDSAYHTEKGRNDNWITLNTKVRDDVRAVTTIHMIRVLGAPLDMQLNVYADGNFFVSVPDAGKIICTSLYMSATITKNNILDVFYSMPLQFVAVYMLFREYSASSLLELRECHPLARQRLLILRGAAVLFQECVAISSTEWYACADKTISIAIREKCALAHELMQTFAETINPHQY